jgi:hypothetical protein
MAVEWVTSAIPNASYGNGDSFGVIGFGAPSYVTSSVGGGLGGEVFEQFFGGGSGISVFEPDGETNAPFRAKRLDAIE